MPQELPAEKIDGTPKKQTRIPQGCLLFMACLPFGIIFIQTLPWNTMPMNGTVIIFDENGETLPFQPVTLTRLSHYAPSFFRSEWKRKSDIYVDKSGNFSSKIQGFTATAFLRTKDRKYAAIVDITPDEPPIGLVIELHSRYTITGRLVQEATGAPFAHQEITLECCRFSEMGAVFPFISRKHGMGEEYHTEKTTTDSEGFFTVNNMIPGTRYGLRLSRPGFLYKTIPLNMPILSPEQYREPFSLGDVAVPSSSRYTVSEDKW